MSNEGPPARNTRSSTRGARRGQIRRAQGVVRPVPRHGDTIARSESAIPREGTITPREEETTPHEEIIASRDDSALPRDEDTALCEESLLTSIAETSNIEQTSPRRETPADNALSEHETIRENMEKSAQLQEQAYNTVSASIGPSAGPTIFSTPFSEVPTDKGKRRATGISHGSETFTSPHKMREVPPHMAYADKDRELFERTIKYWSDRAKESRVDAIQQRQELSEIHSKISGLDDLKSKIVDSYTRTNEFEDAMESMQYMFRRLSEGQSIYIHLC